MELINWLPSITTTSLLMLALWLGRKLIETRLTKSVEHEFSKKIEEVRAEFREKEEILKADLRSKENEIAALRSGAMTAMASRQIALDRRRLKAVDQLWSAIISLGPAKAIAPFVASLNFEAVAEEASKNSKFREVFAVMSSGLDSNRIDLSGSEKARPFVSPMAWALFSAYQAIAMLSVAKLLILKSGVGEKNLLKKDAVSKLVKAALPDQLEYIDKFGETGYYYLLEEIEIRLMEEMRKMLAGVESDKDSVEKAANILQLSTDIINSANQKSIPLNKTFHKSPESYHP